MRPYWLPYVNADIAFCDAGRGGPSHGLEAELLPRMLDHTIRAYFPDIWRAHLGDTLRACPPYIYSLKRTLLRACVKVLAYMVPLLCRVALLQAITIVRVRLVCACAAVWQVLQGTRASVLRSVQRCAPQGWLPPRAATLCTCLVS